MLVELNLFIGQYADAIEDGDFIGVYPNGLENSWNIGREDSKADDVEFVQMMIDSLDNTLGRYLQPCCNRLFQWGCSDTQTRHRNRSLCGDCSYSPILYMKINHNLTVLQCRSCTAGTEDNACPYDGGVGVLGHDFMPAEESAAVWATHNNCDETPKEGVSVGAHVKMEWENCDNERRVIHYRLNGIGHEVPPDVDGGTNAKIVSFC